jgi:hypothetical protein
MRQLTLTSQAIFEKHSRQSKRDMFLTQMEQVVGVVGAGRTSLSKSGQWSCYFAILAA